MVLLTLREMAKGGMNDQLGGGFHRYSVDERWFVPHFEKMLYDQAQLASSYLDAFQISGDPQYAEVARTIFDYVLRDMTDAGGGFYSAEDADSVIDPEEPRVKGKARSTCGATRRSARSCRSPRPGGSATATAWRTAATSPTIRTRSSSTVIFFTRPRPSKRPRGSSTGRSKRFADGIDRAKRILLEARSARVRPHLDDKILTSWNGLMISALALGGAVLDEPRYAEAARRAAEFLLERMYNPRTGVLLRRYRQDDAAIPGFLDDYALFAQALLDLYEAQFDRRYLELAVRLTEKQIELFEDRQDRRASSVPPPATTVW